MTDAGNASPYSQQAVLRNGTPVQIRVALPEDRDKVVAAFNELEPDSVYTRFFSMRKGLSDAELDRMTTSDFVSFLMLAATVGAGADETVIGGASYVVLPPADGARAAEVAFTIEEDYQGQGLAGKLMAMLAGIARQHGIDRLEADVLAGNAPMLAVFERSGLPLTKTREAGVTHVVMNLRQDSGKP
jgi:RimJ/RimL family protein N-acetyltransferase